MSWKEREVEIHRALDILRSQQLRYGRPGARIHGEGMVDRAARIKALEYGPCRKCGSLIVEDKKRGKFLFISLSCEQGASPLDLHRPYVSQLGEVPECDLFVSLEDSLVEAGVLGEELI